MVSQESTTKDVKLIRDQKTQGKVFINRSEKNFRSSYTKKFLVCPSKEYPHRCDHWWHRACPRAWAEKDFKSTPYFNNKISVTNQTTNLEILRPQTTRKWVIGLQKILQSPLPLISIFSKKKLMKYIKYNNTPAIELENYPCHTQAVKQCVKLVSNAAGAVCEQKQRDGFISIRISSRQSIPNLKTQYCV